MLRLSSALIFLLFFFQLLLPLPRPIVRNNKPQYGAWGFDLAGADTKNEDPATISSLSNGALDQQNSDPPDKPAYSLRLAMTDLTEQQFDGWKRSAAKDVTNPSTLEDKVAAFIAR